MTPDAEDIGEYAEAKRIAWEVWLPAAFAAEKMPDLGTCQELVWAFTTGWRYRAGEIGALPVDRGDGG